MKVGKESKRILNFLALILFVGVVTFLVTQSVGLGAGGFSSAQVLTQFSFYLVGGVFLFLLICGFIIELIIRKGDEKYGNSIGFSSLGETPHIPFFKRFSQVQILLLSLITFGILGLFAFMTKLQSFADFAVLEQQFTKTGELLFSTLLVAGAENLGLALVIVLTFIILRVIARKTDMSKASFNIYAWTVIPLIGAIYWIINHLLRYSGSDLDLLTVFFFGLIMAFLTIMTGSFIPAWVMHASNNLFFDLQRLFSSESVLGMAIGVIVLLIIAYGIIYRKKLAGRKKSEE